MVITLGSMCKYHLFCVAVTLVAERMVITQRLPVLVKTDKNKKGILWLQNDCALTGLI